MSTKIGYKLEKIETDFISEALNTSNAKDLVVEIVGSNTASGTIQIVGAIEQVDFSKPSQLGNAYETIQVIDLQDGTAIDGDTGITFSGDDVRLVELNTNALQYIGVIITGVTGRFDIQIKGK